MERLPDAINAIYYAINMGARVASKQLVGRWRLQRQALAEAIAYAYDEDMLFIAAAGNSTNNNDLSPSYPASYDIPSVVAVAASR